MEECCLDLLPRKVSAELTFYQSVEPVLTGFFEFLQEKGHITKAPALISRLKKVSGTMIKLAETVRRHKRTERQKNQNRQSFDRTREMYLYLRLWGRLEARNSAGENTAGRRRPTLSGMY